MDSLDHSGRSTRLARSASARSGGAGGAVAREPERSRLLTYEQRTYLVELPVRQHKMCMAHRIDNRVPLLGHGIVELAEQTPTALKVCNPRLPRSAQGDYFTERVIKEMAATTVSVQVRLEAGGCTPCGDAV